ncbi:MAG: lipocalin family protein [Deltaproteobacteria bacterium]|nr:lipocalin family protein [Deltaproteobacteria bacterium]
MRLASVLLAAVLPAHASLPDPKGLEVVPYVDVQRYIGTWYEIAAIPQSFQRGCTASTATYTLQDDGTLKVLNQCRKGGLDGKVKVANGRAWIVDPSTNAKLKVSFFWPFSGDYWIIDLAPDYTWAVVGHPSRDYLWILARQPRMDPTLYQTLLGRLGGVGYDTGRVERTLQP